jgi:integrase
MKFTQTTVKAAKVPPGKSEAIYFDDELPGFGLRVRAGGSARWIVQYKLGDKQRRMTFGTLDQLPPAKAREMARDLLAAVRSGRDPQAEKMNVRTTANQTFGVVLVSYLARQEGRLKTRSFSETKRILTTQWKPLHGLSLDNIGRATIADLLFKIADKNGKHASTHARSSLSAFFSWAMREGLCETNPVIATNKAIDPVVRDRVLADNEFRAIWEALPDSDYGRIVRLLILTGCRREEIGSLAWSEVDLENHVIVLPGERTKNKRAHQIPLSDMARNILRDAPNYGGSHVFGRKGNGFSGWSRAKRKLDAELPDIEQWRIHDIRRTVATGMADLGVQPHIVEAVLNHVSGHKAGVAGIYNRAAYSKEKTDALNMWANHISVLLSGADNVHRLESA